jgi:hypothetical protein
MGKSTMRIEIAGSVRDQQNADAENTFRDS